MRAMKLVMLALLLVLSSNSWAVQYGPYSVMAPAAIDGDTISGDLPIFPGITADIHIRVVGVDTPEIRGKCVEEKEAAKTATTFTEAWLRAHAPITVIIVKQDVYPKRYDGIVMGSSGERLSDALIKAGLGRPSNGGKRLPWCVP